jgi:hypothetical protein
MNVYGVRIGFSLLILLVSASGLMAHTKFKAKVTWDPPVDSSGQPVQNFDHYRLYICSQPIDKEESKVVCHGGNLIVEDVSKDRHEADIEYDLPTAEDNVYFRATTRTQDREESDLSKQLMFTPHRFVPLANSYYMTDASNQFESNHPVEHLWDGCIENEPQCTGGSKESEKIWIEFDFKNLYLLQYARLFGDAEGTWQSWNWSLSHKLEKNDPWQSAFTKVEVEVSDWVKQELRDIPARYVRVEISGTEGTNTVQARELAIVGERQENR